MSGATKLNQTKPKQTKPNQTKLGGKAVEINLLYLVVLVIGFFSMLLLFEENNHYCDDACVAQQGIGKEKQIIISIGVCLTLQHCTTTCYPWSCVPCEVEADQKTKTLYINLFLKVQQNQQMNKLIKQYYFQHVYFCTPIYPCCRVGLQSTFHHKVFGHLWSWLTISHITWP